MLKEKRKLALSNKQIIDEGHIQSVLGKYGRTHYFRHDEYVGRSIFQYGEFSPEECDFIVSLAGDGLVLDIGANIGCISQALATAGKTVSAFEPQPAVYELLVRNVPKTVKCYNVGLGSKNSTEYMPKVDYSKRGNFGGLGVGAGTLPVKIVTLDSFEYDDVSLIKIDVEGYEEEVLRGAVETIARCKPTIYLEADRPEKLASLANFLDSIGYKHAAHNPPLFSPNNFFNNPKLAWDKAYISMNWICTPI